MDAIARAYFTAQFTTAFHRRAAGAFQDLFADIMECRYGAGFHRVRPWGSRGDRKNDGYLALERTLFQVYAPREMSADKAIEKIDADFRGASPYWEAHFDTWIFVHNDPEGVGPDVERKLLELNDSEPVTVGHWGYTRLLDIVLECEASALARILGDPPAQRATTGWRLVEFDVQRDLRSALLGHSLGPRDVVACPEAPEVREVLAKLEASDAVAIVGPSGSGKSITAWHVCHELHSCGWMIFQPCGNPVGIPEVDEKAVLLMDDAQALGVAARASQATPSLRLLAVSTGPVPGFRTQVAVAPKRAVAALAAELEQRADSLLPVLREFDSHVGNRPFDKPVERAISHAAHRATRPWQFMFNLGSGHLRLRKVLTKLHAEPPLFDLLFAISLRQLATTDAGCPLPWLAKALERMNLPSDGIEQWIETISAELPLICDGDKASTPHPMVASRVVNACLYRYRRDAEPRRRLFFDQFEDRDVGARGFAWLLSYLDHDTSLAIGTPEADFADRALASCFAADERADACWGAEPIVSRWRPNGLSAYSSILTAWIEEGESNSAYALGRLVNAAANEESGARRGERRTWHGVPWVSASDPQSVARWASRAQESDAAPLGALLNRLVHAGSMEWRAEVARSLDEDAVCSVVVEGGDDVYGLTVLVEAIYYCDEEMGLRLAWALAPALARAINDDPLDGWFATQDLFNHVCGHIGRVLGGDDPTAQQNAVVREVTSNLDPAVLAGAVSGARRRDWETWGSAISVFCESDPDFGEALARELDMDQVKASFEILADSPHELDRALLAMIMTPARQPARRLVEHMTHHTKRLDFRAAYIAPEALPGFLDRNGVVSLGLSGGIPRWKVASTVLRRLQRIDVTAAGVLLRQQEADLADGLALKQSNSTDGLCEFLEIAAQVDSAAVPAALARIDPAAVRDNWSVRLLGSPDERAAMEAVLRAAPHEAQGIQRLAQELLAEAGPDQ